VFLESQAINNWEFIGEKGDFRLEKADQSSYLYFPLTNEAGMMSSITPLLKGDIKSGQNTFALTPVSAEDLHNNKSGRNFWLLVDDKELISAVGNSAKQRAERYNNGEKTVLEAGLLWHKIIRKNNDFNIKTEITNFVPANEEKVELMQVKIINTGDKERKITPTAAVPIYGRSADNLRDHRHVTSLLNHTQTLDYGVAVSPTLSFDERGHQENEVSYAVLGAEESGDKPLGFYPIVEEFIGEGGSLDWPEAVLKKSDEYVKADQLIKGYESIGALRFEDIQLKPGESRSYITAVIIDEGENILNEAVDKYLTEDKFAYHLNENKTFWEQKIDKLQIESSQADFDRWMRWVTLQPILRRIYGCSFLPHHDYGRGGRGWRDLWQDNLALLLMEPDGVRESLLNNFAGIRIDGTNATIIGSKPGEFIADRNNISRVWMDHGSWPFLTTKLYIDQSGDLEFLLENQSYFKDSHTSFGKELDENWEPEDGNKLLDQNNNIYQGTIIEHLLVQHLTIFFNVGENNNLKLEGADWNDGLDMAEEKGESVAFTALYASNLLEMADLLKALKEQNSQDKLELAEEVEILFDSIGSVIDYDSVGEKRERLVRYFDSFGSKVSGNKIDFEIDELRKDLKRKAEWIFKHLRKNEWLENEAGYSWFNGYYNNNGERLEGDHPLGVRMTLTGQVFSIMSGAATDKQVEKIIESADHYLKDSSVGGYRLNTDFKEVLLDMGRAFGFAYGHKENGAMFSHMAVMYSNALYQRGFAKAGYEVISSIYDHASDFEKSRIYPGIPEYINQKGRGMYHYLTGSASWLLLTMVTQVYGVRGRLGDLILDPKLLGEQFDENGHAAISTVFADRKIEVIYNNQNQLNYPDYRIKEIKINNEKVDFSLDKRAALLKKDLIEKAEKGEELKIEVKLY